MSGATGAAGGAAGGGLPGAAQSGMPYGGGPQPPAEHPAASTSLMPPVASAGQGGTYGGAPQPPAQPPAAGFSTPTTYAKGQPTPARGTRVNSGAPAAPAARRGGPAQSGGPVGQQAGGLSGRVRKARLRVTRADPWSVMKVSFLLSLAVGIIMIVAAAVLWMTLDGLGVFTSLNSTLKEVTGSADGASSVNLMDYIGFSSVMLFTTLIAVVDVILMTALATLSAFIYNTAAGFTGGIELTLAEED
ncbi:DUF3566 domain-containing protein [Kitasatospora sp. MAP5-34]|uniref:DUF3566 domain-containing protein n=1 Tax=Kitasatospora sp. MAP5-34 TaxID=3035102 RepID=UPI002475900F|nr:DUF3566 domain-containing protein [Kitasatospora sp. MAP5-34]MDH6576401.1 hypothetical protein [Kitasatospora sp. MAP5-34]